MWKVSQYGVFAGPYFPLFSCISTECRKIQTRKTSVFGHFSRSEHSSFDTFQLNVLFAYPLNTLEKQYIFKGYHCVKSVRIRSYSGLYFPAFRLITEICPYCPYFPALGLNTERYGVSLHIQCKCGKIRIRITRNTDTSNAVYAKEAFATNELIFWWKL